MKLTRAKLLLIREALNGALLNETSYAEAWECDPKIRAKSQKLIKRFKILRKEISVELGHISGTEQFEEDLMSAETRTLKEIKRMYKAKK